MLSIKLPRLWILLLTVAVASGFFSLAYWQFGRALYKEAILAELQSAQQAAPQALTEVLGRDDAPEHLPVFGVVTPLDRSVLLDNQIRERETGVEVFTPARVEGDDRLLLLARGWLPIDRSLRRMPAVPISEQPIVVSGRLARAPSPGFRMGRNLGDSEQNWPKLVVRLEFDELEALYGERVHKRVLWLDPGPHSWEQRFEPVSLPPERHRGYALQWFGLGVAVIVVFLVLHLRKRVK